MNNPETLCWTCQKAIGECPWSKHFSPVSDWQVIPNIIYSPHSNGGGVESFLVLKCPMYKRDNLSPKWKSSELSKILGISIDKVYRYKQSGKIEDLIKQKEKEDDSKRL